MDPAVCTLGSLRKEIDEQFYTLDFAIRDLTREKLKAANGVFGDFQLYEDRANPRYGYRGMAFVKGSTSLSRRTYVVNPGDPYLAFPPDLDLNVFVDRKVLQESRGKKLRHALLEAVVGSAEAQPFADHTHGLYRRVYRVGVMNLSLCIHSLDPEEDFPQREESIYMEEKRLQIRTLKCLFQNHGLYGGASNLAFKGNACEWLIRSEDNLAADVEGALEMLYGLSQMDKAERAKEIAQFEDAFDDAGKPLFAKMSRYAWQRLSYMFEKHLERGNVRATPFDMEDWMGFNERYRNEGFDAFRIATACAPGQPRCGVEASDIARALCRAAAGSKIDYYIVPWQGGGSPVPEEGKMPYTEILLRIARSKGARTEEQLEAIKGRLFSDDGVTINNELLFYS